MHITITVKKNNKKRLIYSVKVILQVKITRIRWYIIYTVLTAASHEIKCLFRVPIHF